jgi:hypothetical protein
MRIFIAISILVALLAAGSGKPVHAGTMDPVASELAAIRDGLNPGVKAEAKLRKTVDKLLAALGSIAPDTPLLAELKISGKVAATIEKSLAGRGNLDALLKQVAAESRTRVEEARQRISVAVALMPLAPKSRASLVKSLTAVDLGLASLTPAASASWTFKVLAKVAKYVDSVPWLPEQVVATWVTTSIRVAPGNEGLDLDGDTTVDNALGALAPLLSLLGLDLDAMLATVLTGSPNVMLIRMWWSENEGGVLVGLVNGLDDDGDLSDNFTGAESFVVAVGLGLDGHPIARVPTSFSAAGSFVTDPFESAGLTIPGLDLPLPETLPLGLAGTASAASNNGLIGFAIPVDLLASALVAMGQPDYTTTLRTVADIDLDSGTPGNEALSMALKFTSVPAAIR